ncbi:MAG: hypothetical protein JWN70_6814 [Planctomycetaceae bacterium]|nr:hypothetical protein [Planctomycetaceae bacterium]
MSSVGWETKGRINGQYYYKGRRTAGIALNNYLPNLAAAYFNSTGFSPGLIVTL